MADATRVKPIFNTSTPLILLLIPLQAIRISHLLTLLTFYLTSQKIFTGKCEIMYHFNLQW